MEELMSSAQLPNHQQLGYFFIFKDIVTKIGQNNFVSFPFKCM